jgi:hypothetical protein
MHVILPRPLFLVTILLLPAFAQSDRVELLSDKQGHAEAKVLGLVLHADEATLNRETGELAMRGHVHASLPAREDHSVVRYGSSVLLTDQPIGLTADRLTVKDGLLQASGHIVVVPADPELPNVQLRGDELFMYLKIADATLKGNLRPNGFPAPATTRAFEHVFPPDIIK